MKQFFRTAPGTVLCCLAVFAGTLTVLWLALLLSVCVPNDRTEANFEKSALLYAEQEPYELTGDSLNDIGDNYADVILLGVAWNMGRQDPLTGSLVTAYYDGEERGENYGLYSAVTEDTPANMDYTRYWHGGALFVRLLMPFTDADGIKTIGFVFLCLLLAFSCVWLVRGKHADLALLLLLSMTAVQFWNIRLSMEYQSTFILGFLFLPLFLYAERRGDRPLLLLAVVSGVSASFFDFLTTETVTILLPLAVCAAVRAKEKRFGTFSGTLRSFLGIGMAWLGSYGMTFVVKWAAASAVSGENAFRQAFSSVGERIGGNIADFAEPPDNIFSAPLANLGAMFGAQARLDYGRIALGVGLSLLLLFSVWYLFRTHDRQSGAAGILLLLGAAVLLRFFVLNNHAYLHCAFTYRALVTTVFCLLAALRLNIRLPMSRPEKNGQNGRTDRQTKKGGRR